MNTYSFTYLAQVVRNRSPKGNIHVWSVIAVALLYMLANGNERKQGMGPKGDKVL